VTSSDIEIDDPNNTVWSLTLNFVFLLACL